MKFYSNNVNENLVKKLNDLVHLITKTRLSKVLMIIVLKNKILSSHKCFNDIITYIF